MQGFPCGLTEIQRPRRAVGNRRQVLTISLWSSSPSSRNGIRRPHVGRCFRDIWTRRSRRPEKQQAEAWVGGLLWDRQKGCGRCPLSVPAGVRSGGRTPTLVCLFGGDLHMCEVSHVSRSLRGLPCTFPSLSIARGISENEAMTLDIPFSSTPARLEFEDDGEGNSKFLR